MTLAVVVASFVGGAGYGGIRANRTHDADRRDRRERVPKHQHLAAARARLRNLRACSTPTSCGPRPASRRRPRRCVEVRDRLRANIEALLRAPAFADERELWQRIEKELTDVDVLAGKIVDATAAGR